MNILALNAGSSTLKFKLFDMPPARTDDQVETVLAEGVEEHSGGDIVSAAQQAITKCDRWGISAVGHRVVHGGTRFSAPIRMTTALVRSLREIADLDPLHNATETAMIDAALKLLPDAPSVAVFDTAFHQTLPETAWRYALPWHLADQLSLRRYGFHGISHQFVSERLLKCIGRSTQGTKVITCHLGNGASVCAVRDGKSVDTSMGMTPLEGLVMGTRCGDIDAGLLLYLRRATKMTTESLDELLNKKSGLLGLSGLSSDVRDLEKSAAAGDERSETALEIFAYRVCKYIGAYAAALEGVDAVAFAGGVGEHSADMRRRICRRLGFLGIVLDDARNIGAGSTEPAQISAENACGQVWVVPTNEELQIARETQTLLAESTPIERL